MLRAAGLPAALLLAYGVAFAARALGRGPLGFDDHPGQLARLTLTLADGPAPWAWSAGWWAGYPELQFYPPGWFYLGAGLSWLSLGTLGPEAVYQTLLWATYLAPGATAFLFLQRALGDGWRALPGAFLALTLAGDPAGGGASGVEGGVHIGMVAARLAWALLPLLAWTLVPWSQHGDRIPLRASVLIAVIVLTHPAHVPAALAIVAAAALVAPAPRPALRHAALAVGLALLLAAFWLVPLAWRIEHTRALAWGALAPAALATPFGAGLIGLAVLAGRVRGARATLTALGLAVVAVGVVVLVAEPLGIRSLPADRVADGAWLLLLLAAGLGAGFVVDALRARVPRAATALLVVALLVAFAWPGRALLLWPRATDWPSVPEIERGLRLDALWQTLRAAPPGRVLFVRSGVPLVFGEAWYRPHTHVTALTPARTDREILGGTFTHPSPVAAFAYRGDASGAPIARLAEQLDGVSLLGRPLAALEADTLERFTRRFRVAAIVALDEDAPSLGILHDTARWRRLARPPFLVFITTEPPMPARRVSRGAWDVTVDGPGWTSTSLAYYPLWRASLEGAPVSRRRGDAGDLEVRTGRDGAAVVRLAYGPGAIELVGLGLSAAGIAALGGLAGRRRRALRRVGA